MSQFKPLVCFLCSIENKKSFVSLALSLNNDISNSYLGNYEGPHETEGWGPRVCLHD